MVKNTKGGNKSKKIGRKFLTAPVSRQVRLAKEEGEIYAVVTKNLGNGMFYVNDTTGKELLCIMRRKFKGRGKRDNIVSPGGWVLVGAREFESCSKPKYDLLEVYTDIEKQKLKNSGDPIFLKLKSNFDKSDDENENELSFEYDDSDNFQTQSLLKEVNSTTNNTTTNIIIDDSEPFNFDDI
jgi:translation initiation factor IF-1